MPCDGSFTDCTLVKHSQTYDMKPVAQHQASWSHLVTGSGGGVSSHVAALLRVDDVGRRHRLDSELRRVPVRHLLRLKRLCMREASSLIAVNIRYAVRLEWTGEPTIHAELNATNAELWRCKGPGYVKKRFRNETNYTCDSITQVCLIKGPP